MTEIAGKEFSQLTNLNITDELRVQGELQPRQGVTVTDIFSADDFPAPVAGVITLTSGLYLIKDNVSVSDRFVIADNASVIIESVDIANTALTYTGSGTMFSAPVLGTVFFQINNISIVLTGNGAQVFDLVGGILSMDTVALIATGTTAIIGTVESSLSIVSVVFTGFTEGLMLLNSENGLISRVSVNPPAGSTATYFSFIGTSGRMEVSDVFLNTLSGESAFFIEPTIVGPISIISTADTGTGAYFEAGDNGIITAFTDASFTGETITSVTDSGGIARFNFTAPPTLFVGQQVTIAGFVVNTSYNATGIITVTGAGFFEISSIAFVADESGGSFEGDSVTVTSAGHGQSNGTPLLIDNNDYNGGFDIYNALTNTFQINVLFVTAETSGLWNAGSLDEKDSRMFVADAGAQKSSATVGSLGITDNSTATVINTQNVFEDLNLGATGAAPGSNIERFTVSNRITGEMRYDGMNPASLTLGGLIGAVSAGGANRFNFQLLKNGSPLASPDDVDIPMELGVTLITAPVEWPVTMVTGDKFRLQVANADGTSNITIDTLKYSIG